MNDNEIMLTKEQRDEIELKIQIILEKYQSRKYSQEKIAKMYGMSILEVAKITQTAGKYWHTLDRTGERMIQAWVPYTEYMYLLKYNIQ